MEIGIRIKELRLKNSLTQEELADRCELTKGYISQLENDLTSPSITTLKDILTALGCSLSEFFSGFDEQEPLAYGEKDYFTKEMGSASMKWLVPTSQKNALEPVIVTLEKGGATAKDLPHEGEEFGFILKGSVKLVVGSRSANLTKGMSFSFRSDRTHYIENRTDEVAEILWVTCPPNF